MIRFALVDDSRYNLDDTEDDDDEDEDEDDEDPDKNGDDDEDGDEDEDDSDDEEEETWQVRPTKEFPLKFRPSLTSGIEPA